MIVLLLAFTCGMAWLVVTGIANGTTYFPSKQSSQQRTVSRQQEPITFWISLGIYATLGLGTATLSLWLAHQSHRNKQPA